MNSRRINRPDEWNGLETQLHQFAGILFARHVGARALSVSERNKGSIGASGSLVQTASSALQVLQHQIGKTLRFDAEGSHVRRMVAAAVPDIECVEARHLQTHLDAWAELYGRALEPNIFLHPSFGLPLYRDVCGRSAPHVLLVWDVIGSAPARRLLGLFPLTVSRRSGGTARVPLHELTSNGTPLVDRECSFDVIHSALAWAAGRRAGALSLTSIARDGAFAAELRRVCTASARALVVLAEQHRAVLHRPQGDEERVRSFPSLKRRQQYARFSRRLARAGKRTFVTARSTSDVAAATEEFLALEHKGWKGAGGTALLADPALLKFTRAMASAMALDGRCRIDSIKIDGRPVAMMVVLTDGDRDFLWKTAFDEAHAVCSPGVQLVLELTRHQLADPRVALTDSCAAPDHSVMNRLWPDRTAMIDVLVATEPGGGLTFDLCLLVERARRKGREAVKHLWHATRRSLRLKSA